MNNVRRKIERHQKEVRTWKQRNEELVYREKQQLLNQKLQLDSTMGLVQLSFCYGIFAVALCSHALDYKDSDVYSHLIHLSGMCSVLSTSIIMKMNLERVNISSTESRRMYLYPFTNRHSLSCAFASYHRLGVSEAITEMLAATLKPALNDKLASLPYFVHWCLNSEAGADYLRKPFLGFTKESPSTTVELMCQYHADRAKPVQSDLNDFGFIPFDCLPYEVLIYLEKSGFTQSSPEIAMVRELFGPLPTKAINADLYSGIPEVDEIVDCLENHCPNHLKLSSLTRPDFRIW